MNKPPVEVAIAILYREDAFLMQLRDDNPNIFWPGYWGFFGGHLDPGETPEIAMERELMEEIRYAPPVIELFGSFPTTEVIRHVFHAPLTVPLEDLELHEGWDLGLLTREDIVRGDRHSERAGKVCPLAPPHQQFLLDFMARGTRLIG
ncbi:MAG TPA: NUDIX domain-containing protein [Synechococcales cyanobacterium M55_K2018_004]|nr:NUDIX domain-containing protein [Synechococcales cyanobacterium M55_K2018_004]